MVACVFPEISRWFRNARAERPWRDEKGEVVGMQEVLCPMLLRTTLASSAVSCAAAAAAAATATAAAAVAAASAVTEAAVATVAPTTEAAAAATTETGARAAPGEEGKACTHGTAVLERGGNATATGGFAGESSTTLDDSLAQQQQEEERRKQGREAARRLVAAKDEERRRQRAALLAVDTDARDGDRAAGAAAGDGSEVANNDREQPALETPGRGSRVAIAVYPDSGCPPRDGAPSVDLPLQSPSAKSSRGGGGDVAAAGTLGAAALEAVAAMARNPPLVMSEEALEVLEGGRTGEEGEGGAGAGAGGYGPKLGRVVESLTSLGR